jgi:hypothetical protein
MNFVRAVLLLALLLAGCVGATPVKKNWEWVGAGPEPREGKLLEQYSVCSGVDPGNENAINLCMGDAGWLRRRTDDTED